MSIEVPGKADKGAFSFAEKSPAELTRMIRETTSPALLNRMRHELMRRQASPSDTPLDEEVNEAILLLDETLQELSTKGTTEAILAARAISEQHDTNHRFNAIIEHEFPGDPSQND